MKHIHRDLVYELMTRSITPNDITVILKMIEPDDQFELIIPREYLRYISAEHTWTDESTPPGLEDHEINRMRNFYRKYRAVLVKSR